MVEQDACGLEVVSLDGSVEPTAHLPPVGLCGEHALKTATISAGDRRIQGGPSVELYDALGSLPKEKVHELRAGRSFGCCGERRATPHRCAPIDCRLVRVCAEVGEPFGDAHPRLHDVCVVASVARETDVRERLPRLSTERLH